MDVSKLLTPTDPPVLPYLFIVDFLNRVVKKPWFGDPHVRFAQLVEIQFRLFETGAVIGWALRAALPDLVKTFSNPRQSKSLMKHMIEVADERLRLYESISRQPPETLPDFFLITEFRAKGMSEQAMGASAGKKIELGSAYQLCLKTMIDGIGVGAQHPDLTGEMWRNTFEDMDEDEWTDWRRAGLLLERPPKTITLEERGISVVYAVATFLSAYYPRLHQTVTLKA